MRFLRLNGLKRNQSKKISRLEAYARTLETIVKTDKKPPNWKPTRLSREAVEIVQGRVIARSWPTPDEGRLARRRS